MDLYQKYYTIIFYNRESQPINMLILEYICYTYHYHLPMDFWEGNVFSYVFMPVYSQQNAKYMYRAPVLSLLYRTLDILSTRPYFPCTGPSPLDMLKVGPKHIHLILQKTQYTNTALGKTTPPRLENPVIPVRKDCKKDKIEGSTAYRSQILVMM